MTGTLKKDYFFLTFKIIFKAYIMVKATAQTDRGLCVLQLSLKKTESNTLTLLQAGQIFSDFKLSWEIFILVLSAPMFQYSNIPSGA
jgi:hypothetical protein